MNAPNRICRSIDELLTLCDTISHSRDGCGICPMKYNCIEETTVAQFGYDVPYETVKEMMTTADEITSYCTKDDWEAEQGNLERCDPN